MNFNVYLDVSLDLLILISTIKFIATNRINFTSITIVIHTATATIFVAPNLYKILTILVPAKQQQKF